MIKRKNRIASVDGQLSSNIKTMCQNCYEQNTTSELQIYEMDPNHFMCCKFCGSIVLKSKLRYQSIIGPLGMRGPASFEVATPRRRIFKYKDNSDVFAVTDYPMTPDGKEDRDLREYANS